MADRVTPDKRSRMMAQVKGRNTRPEIVVRRVLHGMGYRFRLHRKDLPGCPDIVLPKHHKIIFVHGCFWHGHAGCRRSARPSSNQEFWNRKIDANIARDTSNIFILEHMGWKVLVIWECKTRSAEELNAVLTDFMMK